MSLPRGIASTELARRDIPSTDNFKLMVQLIRSHVARYQQSLMAPSRPVLQGCPILKLPTEITEEIMKLVDFVDLKAWNLVCRFFYPQVSRRVFKTLNFWTDEQKFIVAPPLGARMRKDLHASRPLSFMKLVNSIQFWAPLVHNLWWEDRCAYHMGSQRRLKEPTYKVLRLFEQLEEDSLLSFNWQMATCIPDGVLSAGSCLVEGQREIKTMSLTTSCCCHHKRKPYVFTSFEHMHSFSWIGIDWLIDVKAVRDFLISNREIIQHLELNYIHWEEAKEGIWGFDRESNVSASVDLPRGSDNIIQEFQSLRYLSLTSIPLTDAVLERPSTLNSGQLQSLKLHHCANTLKFLHAVATAKTPLMLSSLELTVNDDIEADWTGSAVILFIESFQGLEDLHLLISPACPALRYWQAAAKHNSTLRNLAHHERTHTRDHSGDDMYTDLYLGNGHHQSGPLRTEHQLQTLLDCSLDCLGYCDSSFGFQEWLQRDNDGLTPFTFKLLHIRCSETNFDRNIPRFFARGMAEGEIPTYDEGWIRPEHFRLARFVQWAFTSEHLPQLQILALGDFAYNGRFRGRNLLFCRETRRHSDSAFRVMETSARANTTNARRPFGLAEHEMVHFEGIHRPFEFLAACPAETFINRD